MFRILAPIIAFLVDRHDRRKANRYGRLVIRDCMTGRLINHQTMENNISNGILPICSVFPVRLDYC